MKLSLDLHIHSKYSRAVSDRMEIVNLGAWGDKKGIDIIGTGDVVHPLWLKELEANLKPVAEGVFGLKNQQSKTRFILTGEISSIYKQGGQTRRIHNLLIAPSFKTVKKIQQELLSRGCNLMSDGRPIIGLSSIELCDLIFGVDENCLVIPCHVWTPWYSLYGSKSGFDSVRECFGEYTNRIYAIETGLSSDPATNWQIKDLDGRAIVSFSDAHSPEKLGRELTIISNNSNPVTANNISNNINSVTSTSAKNFTFNDLAGAFKQDKACPWQISYTIEFYPEEGKYHYSGHRKCQLRQSPEETKKTGETCPVCGRPMTLGVMHRVSQLAGREVKPQSKLSDKGIKGWLAPNDFKRPPYVKLVPLVEIISEALDAGVKTKGVEAVYNQLIDNLGNELFVLTEASIDEIKSQAGEKVAEGVKKVREGDIVIEPGYDGVFGIVSIWPKENAQIASDNKQMGLF